MSETPNFDEFHLAVGKATTSWAVVEFALDMTIAVMFNGFKARGNHNEVPRSLTRKTSFLKDMAKLETYAHWADEINAITQEVHALKEARHDIVHGVPLSLPNGEALQMCRILFEKRLHRAPSKPVKIADIEKLNAKSLNLSSAILDFAGRLLVEFEADLSNNPPR